MIHPDQVRLGEISVKTLWNCPSSISVGDPVYQNGIDSVDIADCRFVNQMPAEGIVESKPDATTCYVVSRGKVHVDLWGLEPDKEYFIGPGTGIVKESGVPVVPGTLAQSVGRSKNTNDLLVDVREIKVL